MRTSIAFIAALMTIAGLAHAEHETLNEVTEYKLSHQRLIDGKYATKPFSMKMPKCWDHNAENVRVKVAYFDPEADGGSAAYYLPRDDSHAVDSDNADGETYIRVDIKNADKIDMLFVYFIFGVNRGVPCD